MIRHRRRKIAQELNGESRFAKLKEDIRERGIRNPIVLKRVNHKLVAHIGARRLLVANELGITNVPVLIDMAQATLATVQQIEPTAEWVVLKNEMEIASVFDSETRPKVRFKPGSFYAAADVHLW